MDSLQYDNYKFLINSILCERKGPDNIQVLFDSVYFGMKLVLFVYDRYKESNLESGQNGHREWKSRGIAMIEVCFERKTKRQNVWQLLKKCYRRRKKKCRECYKEKWGEEWRIMELPCTYEEAGSYTREWFFDCWKWIKRMYPRQMIYFSEGVKRRFALEEYDKSWICGYLLFQDLWHEVLKQYAIEEYSAEIVWIDTGTPYSFLLAEVLAKKGKQLEVVTTRPEAWSTWQEHLLEEWGIGVEILGEVRKQWKKRVIIDLYGLWIFQFALWAKENVILAWELSSEKKEFLKDRSRKGRIVTGFQQSIYGEKISNRLAAVYMQSRNWKVRQLADTQETEIDLLELKKINEKYEWKMEGLEIC